jgi:hypothetical protein
MILQQDANFRGRATAQAVGRCLSQLPPSFELLRVKSRGICGGQSGTRADCLQVRVFRFRLPVFIPQSVPY